MLFCGSGSNGPGKRYPREIGDLSKSVSTIVDLDIPESDKLRIFGENGKKF